MSVVQLVNWLNGVPHAKTRTSWFAALSLPVWERFGLRQQHPLLLKSLVHALREELRPQQISVTVINPGNVGTPEVLADLAATNVELGNGVPAIMAVLEGSVLAAEKLWPLRLKPRCA